MRAALELLKATDTARLAASIDATAKLSAAAERYRKQADRAGARAEADPDAADPDDTDEDFYDRLARLRGGT